MNNIQIELLIKNDSKEVKKEIGHEWTITMQNPFVDTQAINEVSDILSKHINSTISPEFIKEMLGDLCQD